VYVWVYNWDVYRVAVNIDIKTLIRVFHPEAMSMPAAAWLVAEQHVFATYSHHRS
jgi:hypothetical protein